MNGNCFLDTNVIIYAYSDDEPEKQRIAAALIKEVASQISTQVLQEFCNATRRKFKSRWDDIEQALEELEDKLRIHTNTALTINSAIKITNRYNFSFYDALIIAAALETGCQTLYSEDLQHGQIIDGRLKIQNPFVLV